MLNFIMSERPSVLTRALHNIVAPYADKGEVLIFTPDQFSFRMEKLVYEEFTRPQFLNITVTTPARYAANVLKTHGMITGYADDTVKYSLMYRTLSELRKSDAPLEFYGRKKLGPELIDFSLGMISTLKKAGLTPSDLKKLLSSENEFPDSLSEKLSDILLIYTSYDSALRLGYADKLDDIIRAERVVSEEGLLAGKSCFFVGFDDFSGNQMRLIKTVVETAENTGFFFTTDSMTSEKPQFRCISRLIARISAYSGVRPTETLLSPDDYPETAPSHKHSKIVLCGDIWEECSYIAAEIRRLVTREGYRCKDIAVLSRGGYNNILKSAAALYDIPVFADVPSSIAEKPLIKYILSLLGALSFDTDDIMRYVKSGFVRIENDLGDRVPLSLSEISELERLVRAFGLKSADWLSAFPEALLEKISSRCDLEELRKQIINPLKKLKKSLENTTADKISEALCDFLFNEAKINGTIYGICKAGGGEGTDDLPINEKAAEEYRRIWDLTVTVFEALHSVLGGVKMPLEEYAKILRDTLSRTSVANPPEVLDAVTCGDIERTRTEGAKIIFICGFCEGLIPALPKTPNGFTNRENEALSSSGINLCEDRTGRSSREHFLAHKAITQATDSVIITCPLLDGDFSEREPSRFIGGIKEKLGLTEYSADAFGAELYCSTDKAAELYAYSHYSTDRQTALSAAEALGEGYTEKLRALLNMQSFNACRHTVSPDTAEKLFTQENYSPSALEALLGCHFAYFCKYGLGLFEDGEKELSKREIGNAMHYVLKDMLEEYKGRYDKLREMDENELSEMLKGRFEKYESETYPEKIGADKRFSYVLSRLSTATARLLRHMAGEMSPHGFEPEAFEKEISYSLGGKIPIKGRFDRLDSHTDELGNKYLRVIDYKTGGKKMTPESVFYGKNLQMLLYLFGLCENGDKPSGVGYISAKPIDKEKTTSEMLETVTSVEKRCKKAYQASGLAVENNFPDIGCGTVLTQEEYGKLKKYCEDYIDGEIRLLKNGSVDAIPVIDENPDGAHKPSPCRYCRFAFFCGNEALGNYLRVSKDRMYKVMED